MATHSTSRTTGRYISRWAYATVGTAILLWFALMSAPFWERLVLSKSVNVPLGEAVELRAATQIPQGSLDLKPSIGALRIEIDASLSESWVTYEIQVRDKQGQVIASAVKDAWAESGSWYEDGESGTWNEADTQAQLDLISKRSEPVTLAIALLDHSNTLGQELDRPVTFDAKVWQGVIDRRYLWAGAIATSILSLLTLLLVPTTGKRMARRSEHEAIVHERATIKQRDRFLRVTVNSRLDILAPASFDLKLAIYDAENNEIYTTFECANVSFSKSKGKVTAAKLQHSIFLVLSTPGSYLFHVSFDHPQLIYQTTLTIYEDARTRIPVTVHSLP